MLHHQLSGLHPHVFVDSQPVGNAGGMAGLGAEIELNGVDAGAAFAQAQLEVLFLQDSLLFDLEFIQEQWRRKALAPDFIFEQTGGFQLKVGAFQIAVSF